MCPGLIELCAVRAHERAPCLNESRYDETDVSRVIRLN